MKHPQLDALIRWLKTHPGIFVFQEEGEDIQLVEIYSGKNRRLKSAEVDLIEEKQNMLVPGETYIIILLLNGHQLVLAQQGFAFAPQFTNTGPLPLPNQVYCMQDFQSLFNKLRHTGSEADRKAETLQLILVLISIIDGAKTVGLDLDSEAEEVEQILANLEKGATLPPPH